MGFFKKREENKRLETEFAGEYIIELIHKVNVEDEGAPYYYLGKEFFLCKRKGQPGLGLKQLTGENAGTIYENVEMNETKNANCFAISIGDFVGLVDLNKYTNERFTIKELTKMAEKHNKVAKEYAKNGYAASTMDQFVVDMEFDTEEIKTED